MFKITVSDAKMWKGLMAAISTLIEEGTFNASEKGISLRAMDPSHVAMVDFEAPNTFFQDFQCDKPSKVCVDIADMLKLIRRVDVGDTLQLELDEEHAKLHMKLSGKYTRRFSVPLLQPSTTDIPTPKLAFETKIKMDSRYLNDAMEDIATVSEQVRLESTPEALTLKSGSETGDVVVEFEKGNQVLLEFEVKSANKALYGVNFLLDIIKAGASSSPVATLEFSSDKPVRLDFELPQGSRLTYYLAPRLE